MNRILTISAVAAALFASSCGLNELNIPLTASGSIVSGAATAGMPFTDDGSAQSAISTSFSSNGVKTFKSATISAGTLTAEWSNSNPTFQTAMTSFTVSISAAGQPTVEIAHADPAVLAMKGSSFPLVLDSVELKPYIDAGSVAFAANPVFASKPEFSVMLTVDMTLHVQIF